MDLDMTIIFIFYSVSQEENEPIRKDYYDEEYSNSWLKNAAARKRGKHLTAAVTIRQISEHLLGVETVSTFFAFLKRK